jgi:hypothetical protein
MSILMRSLSARIGSAITRKRVILLVVLVLFVTGILWFGPPQH